MEKRGHSGSGETRDSLNIFSDPKRRSSGFLSSESFVFLVLDCFSYTAGEKVTGEILFNISEPIPKSVLKFQSRGIEEIHIFDSKDRSKMIDDEIKEIFVLDALMMEWETEIPIGQSVFPFSFKLPSYCPSTFYYSGEDANGFYVKAEVFYHVSVKLIISNCEYNLSHSRIINIKNSSALERPGPTVEATSDVLGCCYSNKGNTHFKLSVGNTDHCQVDGQVKYKLFLDNANCNASINHVIGSIILEFYVHTKKGTYNIIKKLSEVDRATWITANTSLIYDKDFEFFANLKAYSEELNPSSNNSPLISCEYFVEMLIFYDLRFVRNPVVIRLPFHVNPKISLRKEEPHLPDNWNPAESTIFNFFPENRKTFCESDFLKLTTPDK